MGHTKPPNVDAKKQADQNDVNAYDSSGCLLVRGNSAVEQCFVMMKFDHRVTDENSDNNNIDENDGQKYSFDGLPDQIGNNKRRISNSNCSARTLLKFLLQFLNLENYYSKMLIISSTWQPPGGSSK
uniref:Uncharacterized protein n=1 Tax=Romanomermis culicivorax TaxID=13658 RepID=A0A915KKF9_ROMCU